MDASLQQLRSAPEEGAVRGGERQARVALRLVARDPTVRWLVALQALALFGLSAAYYLLRHHTGLLDRDAPRAVVQWLFWFGGGGIATVSSVAVACTVDAEIDGTRGGLPMAFDEVRRRRTAVIWWWLITIVCATGLGYGATAVLNHLPAFLVVAVVWDVASLFVVPAIVLQDDGPLASLGEALRLLRARWGRALAGLFVIGFLFGVAFVACGFLFRLTAEVHPRSPGESFWRLAGPLLVLYLLYALAAATRGAFALILARDERGDLPGEPPTVEPGRRRWATVRRAVLVLVVLFVLAAILRPHSGSTSGPVRHTPHPVTVPPPTVSPSPIHGQKPAVARHGRAHLAIVPDRRRRN